MTISSPKLILIIDDDTIIRNLIAALVRRRGWIAAQAANGEEAITLLETARGSDGQVEYDLIVLDLMMPKKTGWDVIHYLQDRMPQMLRHTLVTSAVADAETGGLTGTCAEVLCKPFEPEAFYGAVRRCLRGPWDPSADLERRF